MNRESERKRLARLLEHECYKEDGELHCESCKFDGEEDCSLQELADYLLDNGVIVPPCKVRDKLYFVYENNVYDMTVEKIVMKEAGLFLVDKGFNDWYSVKEIGKTLYLTREEAEQKLKKRDSKNV